MWQMHRLGSEWWQGGIGVLDALTSSATRRALLNISLLLDNYQLKEYNRILLLPRRLVFSFLRNLLDS